MFFEFRPGTKVAGYRDFIDEHADLIAEYDFVALFDDDIEADAAAIARLFAVAAERGLKIAQPALSLDSYFTYACLLVHKGFQLRYLNFIEMMCPVFRSDILARLRPLLSMGYESGIDLVWCNVVGETTDDFAVVDEVVVRHGRPVGTRKSENGYAEDRTYEDDIRAVLRDFDLPWLACVPYSGIRVDGRRVTHRAGFLPAALQLMDASRRRPGFRQRVRSLAVYWAHLLRRPARNIRVSWPPAS